MNSATENTSRKKAPSKKAPGKKISAKKSSGKKNQEKKDQVDVLIIGGGLVGASLACALENSGHSVAIIEAHPLNAESQPSYDDRTVALSYGSRRIFNAMGLWSSLAQQVEPIKTIHISDRGHFGVTRLRHSEEGVDALGYVAENRTLGKHLYERLEKNSNLHLHCPAQLTQLTQTADQVQVQYIENEHTHEISASVLVAADGVTSQVRELLHIGTSRQDYQQSAIIVNVSPTKRHQNVAYERFTETGPIAFLPMTSNRCSVVWTLPAEQAEALMQLDDAAFLQQLQQNFGYRLGELNRIGRRQQYPLALVESTQLVRGRVVVVGNAAHTLHPVAGQGFNLALRDIALLAELMVSNQDVGDETLLLGYQQLRAQDASRVYRFTDALVKTFSNNFAPLAHARAAGLLAVDLLPSLKHALAKQSMGLGGRLSKLARGLSIGASHG